MVLENHLTPSGFIAFVGLCVLLRLKSVRFMALKLDFYEWKNISPLGERLSGTSS